MNIRMPKKPRKITEQSEMTRSSWPRLRRKPYSHTPNSEPMVPPISRTRPMRKSTLPRRQCASTPDTEEATIWFASRLEEHTSELQSLMRISYDVFCLKKKRHYIKHRSHTRTT